jgi:hypothetical protein
MDLEEEESEEDSEPENETFGFMQKSILRGSKTITKISKHLSVQFSGESVQK